LWNSFRGIDLQRLTKANLETAIELWHRFKGRPMARRAGYLILAAVALEANVLQLIVQGIFKLLGTDLPTPETPHWVSLGFAMLAVTLLFGDRYLPEQMALPTPNPHDVALFKQFRELFDDDMMYFLKMHDFGGSFDRKYFKSFDALNCVWIGSKYEFDDPKMTEILREILPKSRRLTSLMAQYTTSSGDFEWCRPYWHNEDFHSPKTIERVKDMNDKATEIAELIDKLEAEARGKWISTPKS
jgi:hypothetical protein